MSSNYANPLDPGSAPGGETPQVDPPVDPDETRAPPSNRSTKARWLFAAKMVVGLSLCAVIVARVDWSSALSSLAGVCVSA